MTIYHGSIITVDSSNNVFNYLVEDNGKILYTGNELPDKYNADKPNIVELGDRALLPSFADTHQHFASFAIFNAGLNVMEAHSNTEILKMIKEFSENSKEKMLIAFGASPYSVSEKRLVSREELDSVCPDKPFFMVKYDGHACVVNSKLLQKIDDKVRNLRGYHPDTGEMNQEAFFAVSDYISNSISIPNLIKNMQRAVDFYAKQGIGMIHTVSGVGFPFDLDISTETIFAKSVESSFNIRVFPQSLDTKSATKRKLPRIGGCFQCALDGCFGSQDAAMNSAYINDKENFGILYYSDDKVIDFCKRANRLGLQIEMHAIGDRAFDQATRALKAALDDFSRQDHRHGIIHACLPTREGIEICKKYNIQLPMQIAFDDWRQEPLEYITDILGEDRTDKLNPIKTFMDNGCIVSLGSDAPCTSPNPIQWIYKAVNHSNKNQRVSVMDAIRMATYNGYYATFDEKDFGSLEAGKSADMVILSDNPLTVDTDNIDRIKVEKLILSGLEYKNQSQGLFSILTKGIWGNGKA